MTLPNYNFSNIQEKQKTYKTVFTLDGWKQIPIVL